MWLRGRIRESMENVPQELGCYIGRGRKEVSLSSKLHRNILTPGNIPEFCLPPRLIKSPLLAGQRTAAVQLSPRPSLQHTSSLPKTSNSIQGKKLHGEASGVARRDKKPLPFSAEGYGLAGMYECPNTRRKESLFHSTCPGFTLDRTLPIPIPTTRVMPERNLPITNIRSGLITSFPSKSQATAGSIASHAPSSKDPSSHSSLLLPRSRSSPALAHLLERIEEGEPLLQYGTTWGGPLTRGLSCLSLTSGEGRRKRVRVGSLLLHRSTTHPTINCSDPFNPVASPVVPPLLFPLDILHCQERLQREHVLPLPDRGTIRFTTECIASPADTSLYMVRVRVVSVEGLREEGDPQPLNCCLSLSLNPGKLQKQESAVIRNCRSPMFNQDFFFTELSQESLLALELQLKVKDKPGRSALKRGAVLGVITERLAQLLPL